MAESKNEKSKAYKVDAAEYAKFIAQLEVDWIYLLSSTVKRRYLPGSDATLNYQEKVGRVKYEALDSGFRALFPYRVEFVEAGAEESFGEIHCLFAAEYKSAQPMNKETFEVFRDLNLPLNVWPYVREYVHATSNRMGLPPVVLRSIKR
jgi:hypothetical protein